MPPNRVQGGPARPIKVSLTGPHVGGPAHPVYLVQPGDGYKVQGGPAMNTRLITDPNYPVAGGPALPISYVDPSGTPNADGGPAIPISCLNLAALQAAMGGGIQTYSQKIISTFGANLIAYWPMDEASGAVALDASGHNRTGAYTNVTLGQPGIGDGKTCPLFLDTGGSFVNIYTASLAAAFNGSEGTLAFWAKVFNINDYLVPGVYHMISRLTSDGPGTYIIQLLIDNVGDLDCGYFDGATYKHVAVTNHLLPWYHIGVTWSKINDRVRAYLNGIKQGADQNGLGNWLGNLTNTGSIIGAADSVPSLIWHGYLAHGFIANREATPAEMLKAATV